MLSPIHPRCDRVRRWRTSARTKETRAVEPLTPSDWTVGQFEQLVLRAFSLLFLLLAPSLVTWLSHCCLYSSTTPSLTHHRHQGEFNRPSAQGTCALHRRTRGSFWFCRYTRNHCTVLCTQDDHYAVTRRAEKFKLLASNMVNGIAYALYPPCTQERTCTCVNCQNQIIVTTAAGVFLLLKKTSAVTCHRFYNPPTDPL